MNGKRTRGRAAKPADRGTVKVTLTLSVDTARRLAIESAMRRDGSGACASRSAVAEEILASGLTRWRLPSERGEEGRRERSPTPLGIVGEAESA